MVKLSEFNDELFGEDEKWDKQLIYRTVNLLRYFEDTSEKKGGQFFRSHGWWAISESYLERELFSELSERIAILSVLVDNGVVEVVSRSKKRISYRMKDEYRREATSFFLRYFGGEENVCWKRSGRKSCRVEGGETVRGQEWESPSLRSIVTRWTSFLKTKSSCCQKMTREIGFTVFGICTLVWTKKSSSASSVGRT